MPLYDRVFQCNTGQFIGVKYQSDGRIMELLNEDMTPTNMSGYGELNRFCNILSVKIVKEIDI